MPKKEKPINKKIPKKKNKPVIKEMLIDTKYHGWPIEYAKDKWK